MKGRMTNGFKAMVVVALLVVAIPVAAAFLGYTATVSTPYEVAPSISASVVNAQTGNGPCETSWTANAASISCGPASVAAAGDNFTIDVSISGASSTSGTWESSLDTTCGGNGTSGTFDVVSGLASLTCTVTAASGGGSSNIILDLA